MTTFTDRQGPTGPFLLEVLLTDPCDPSRRRWGLLQSVDALDTGLAVASRMSQAYHYRLYLSPECGYLYLDWQDDADGETCSPVWVRR